jgi:hypothetical protein
MGQPIDGCGRSSSSNSRTTRPHSLLPSANRQPGGGFGKSDGILFIDYPPPFISASAAVV